ncbi:hypothetical protein L7F22_009667 [Adiantum nelumboides]|nr:hypothetical protein [Adiantum nelumboides]
MARSRKRKQGKPTDDAVELKTREMQKLHPNQRAGQGQIIIPQKKLYRQRAHVNPFSDHNVVYPSKPELMDWHFHFPTRIPSGKQGHTEEAVAKVEFADIGCGFGGLLFYLAPHFPEKLMVGMEIRTSVTQYVHDKVQVLRKASHALQPSQENHDDNTNKKARLDDASNKNSEEGPSETEINTSMVKDAPNIAGNYDNISAMRVNAMKHLPNFFQKGQLSKLFFLHPDPHFKQRKSKNRIISPTLLAEYAYILRPDGILYTITDVEDLHVWMVKHLTAFPLFERIPDDDPFLKHDVCVDAVWNATEEGQKVIRNKGSKWFAAFRRIRDPENEESIE